MISFGLGPVLWLSYNGVMKPDDKICSELKELIANSCKGQEAGQIPANSNSLWTRWFKDAGPD
ncbi:hypothetical protein J6590_068617 [Homalodisca vitripennis]|nr:hypothetical protein J6590_068617 [Homalodisca vitripennis]